MLLLCLRAGRYLHLAGRVLKTPPRPRVWNGFRSHESDLMYASLVIRRTLKVWGAQAPRLLLAAPSPTTNSWARQSLAPPAFRCHAPAGIKPARLLRVPGVTARIIRKF